MEKAESKCEFCEQHQEIEETSWGSGLTIKLYSGELCVRGKNVASEFSINYCPMCGKPIKR